MRYSTRTEGIPIRTLRIVHRTRYSYDRPVVFGEHRLLIRPRDGHDLRVLDSSLTVSPRADVHWAFDTFGNSVALLSFLDAGDELVIESELLLRRYGLDEPMARFERYAGEVERQDLLLRGQVGIHYGLQDWARLTAGVWYMRRSSESIFPEVEYDDVNFHVLATVLY